MSSNILRISACSNELIISAYQKNASYQLVRLLCPDGAATEIAIEIVPGQYAAGLVLTAANDQARGLYTLTLQPGSYQLIAGGLNWDPQEPGNFAASLNDQALDFEPNAKPAIACLSVPIRFEV